MTTTKKHRVKASDGNLYNVPTALLNTLAGWLGCQQRDEAAWGAWLLDHQGVQMVAEPAQATASVRIGESVGMVAGGEQ